MPLASRRPTSWAVAPVDHGADEHQVGPGRQKTFDVVVIGVDRLASGGCRPVRMAGHADNLVARTQFEQVFGVGAVQER